MSAQAPAIRIDLVLGPLIIGVIVNVFVFGICCLQLVNYLAARFNDPWKIRVLLWWVIIVDTFTVCSTIGMIWHYCVSNFSNVLALASSPWEYATLPIFSTLAAVPIQHFMAWRIKRFSKSIWLFIYISVLSITQGALACASATMGLLSPSIASHVKIIPVADAWLATAAACDTSITLLLLYYLIKSRTGFKKTDHIILSICTKTVEAALPVTILCILDLIFLTKLPNFNLHFMCALPVGRLYTNSLLTTLNARESLRRTMDSSVHNSGIQLSNRNIKRMAPTEVVINVEQDTHMDMMKSNPDLASTGSNDDNIDIEALDRKDPRRLN